MDEQQQPEKRKRGRPPGTKNKPGHKAGRKDGFELRPKMSEVIDPAEMESYTPDKSISRPAVPLPMDKALAPATMLPVAEEPTAVPNMIRSVLAIRNTVDLNNPATLFNAMEQYIQLCSMTGMKIANSTMYMACGVSNQDIYYWKFGKRRQNNPAYRQFAELTQQICAAAREQYGIEGQVNPILTIFHQKFYDGFTDTPTKEGEKDPLGEITDPQKLAEKYKDIITD